MRYFILLSGLVILFSTASATLAPVRDGSKASAVFLPIGTTGKSISIEELSAISLSEFEHLTGKKMRFFDRISFRLAQRELRNSIREDGTITGKKAKKLAVMADGEKGFQAGGFFLGFFVGLIGVLIAYLINDDKKSNRVKWAWIGFGVYAVLLLALVLALPV